MSEHCCQHDESEVSWEQQLDELLPLFGHRNWIVVADAAYPAQTRPGIDTAVIDCSQLEAVKKVLAAIHRQPHVRALVLVDQELEFVAEKDAKGVGNYRRKLKAELGASLATMPHEQIIARLDKAAEIYRVLILKTAMTIPYTSVFFELDCGYWSAAAEKRLRATIAAREKKTK